MEEINYRKILADNVHAFKNCEDISQMKFEFQSATTNTVTPESWGLSWSEREYLLRNALVSNPNATVTRLYSR